VTTQQMIDRIEQIKTAGNYTWKMIAGILENEYGKSFSSDEACRSWYRRNKNGANDSVKDMQLKVPVAAPKTFGEVLQLPGNKATLVLADIHAPYHDEQFIVGAVENALESFYELEQIIIAGDLFDLSGLSRFPKDSHTARLDTELQTAGSILLYLAEYAPVFVCVGNHDTRLKVRLDSPLSFERVISAALNGRKPKNQITVTDREYMFVGSKFVVGHLSNYSTTAGKLAYGIAQRYKRHALVGHDHLSGVFGSLHSQYLGASIGCSAKTDAFWYSESKLNTLPPMQQGYALINGTDDSFSLFNGAHQEYFTRVRMNNGMCNCYMVREDT
jgi:predicted phosphodiesterase